MIDVIISRLTGAGDAVSVHSLLVEGGAQDKVPFMALGFADHPCHGRDSLVTQLAKNPPAMKDDPGLIPGSGRSPGGGKGYPLQYSGLENSMDYIVHGVTKSWTRLRDFHTHT